MKQLIAFVLCVYLCTACIGQEAVKAGLPTNARFEAKVDAYVRQYIDLDIFSGVVLVAENGQPIYQKAFGLANREKNTPNNLNTRFDIGSINKFMTKVVILQLIQEGKVKPNDNLGKYLKGFPETAAAEITIQHLMSHKSGYGDYMQQPGFFSRSKSEQTIGAIIEMVKKMPLMFKPGEEQEYSNAGYILLGGIIETVTGKSYYENIKERIVNPLGMNDTIVDDAKASSPNRAIGYLKTMKGELEDNEEMFLIPTPAGGFLTTAADLLKFFEAAFYSDKLLTESGRKLDDGFAFFERARQNGNAIPIAGGFQGANAVVFNILKDHKTIIVLANMDEPVAEHLGSGIFRIMNGKDPDKPSLPAMQSVYRAFKEKGTGYLKQNFDELTSNFNRQGPKDMILNNVGYNLLSSGQTDDAIQVFKLNTELFPNIANCWDSYGEALLMKGDKAAALAAYKKALSIKPDLPSAKDAVKKLESEQP